LNLRSLSCQLRRGGRAPLESVRANLGRGDVVGKKNPKPGGGCPANLGKTGGGVPSGRMVVRKKTVKPGRQKKPGFAIRENRE